jgi:hypothetical protein
VLEWLYLRSLQTTPPVRGTDPDTGGHGTLRVGWNDARDGNRPLFVVIMGHSAHPITSRLLVSPKQIANFNAYIFDALSDQSSKFGYADDPPDWDTRYMRVPE